MKTLIKFGCAGVLALGVILWCSTRRLPGYGPRSLQADVFWVRSGNNESRVLPTAPATNLKINGIPVDIKIESSTHEPEEVLRKLKADEPDGIWTRLPGNCVFGGTCIGDNIICYFIIRSGGNTPTMVCRYQTTVAQFQEFTASLADSSTKKAAGNRNSMAYPGTISGLSMEGDSRDNFFTLHNGSTDDPPLKVGDYFRRKFRVKGWKNEPVPPDKENEVLIFKKNNKTCYLHVGRDMGLTEYVMFINTDKKKG